MEFVHDYLPIMSPNLTISKVPSIMVAWGLVMTLMSLVKSFEALVVCVLCCLYAHVPQIDYI